MRRHIWAIVLLWGISGCGCDEATPPGQPGTLGEPCDLVAGCMGDLVCEAGVCASEDTCTDSGGMVCGASCCAAQEVCQAGTCLAACPTALCGAAGVCCGDEEFCHEGALCCLPDRVCGEGCCGAGELCEAGECKVDCGGGVPGCGATQACCGASEICYLDQCLLPGDPCVPGQACATRPEERPCPPGQICEPSLMLCVPQDINESCTYVPPAGVFDPVPLFTWGQRRDRACANDSECQKAEICQAGTCAVTWPHISPAADDMPDHYQSSSIPMVADLNADCVPEIVFNTYADSRFTSDGVIRAVRGDDGAKVWTVSDPAYRTDATANPAIGDVDGDGQPEIFVSGPGKNVLCINGDGTPRWISDTFAGPESSASVALANLDSEGHAEIILGAAVFDSEGNLLFEGTAGAGLAGQGPISCIADLDGDRRPEIIAGNTVYETSGTVAAANFAGAVRATAMAPDGYCGIADLDGDEAPEVVLVTQGMVYVLQGQTMATLASLAIPGGGNGGAPNIADFDGDGTPDIGTAGANNYVVLRYGGPDQLSVLWSAPTEDDSSSRTGSSVFDFDGDGRAEVIYNDEEFVRIYPGVEPDCLLSPVGPGCDGIMNDDEILFRDLNSSRTRTEYPVIADVDGDFKAEIVFATSNEATFLDPAFRGDAGIEVWADRLDNWVSTRPVWNQHSYHITNTNPQAAIPNPESDSWTFPTGAPFNSYRRNAQGDLETFCAPDLVVRDVAQDTSSCPELVLNVTVVNQGCLGVGPGVQISIYDANGALVAQTQSTEAIGPGSAVVVQARAARGDSFSEQVLAAVDDDGMGAGALNECEEGNNRSDLVLVECKFDF